MRSWQAFVKELGARIETLARDLNQTLSMVTRTEDSSAGRNVQYVERLVDFVDRLESAVRSGDLPRLAAQASDLRDFAQSIELDSRDDFARLRQKMIEIQRRLHEVELLATLDPLTGVANRRELDRELAARIEARQEFCVLLFDLNGFKEINDRFGHLYGDEVLKQLAARLSGQVRARDYVCRWGGDEFVAILVCDLAIAEFRSQQIAERLNGPYRIRGAGARNPGRRRHHRGSGSVLRRRITRATLPPRRRIHVPGKALASSRLTEPGRKSPALY